MTYAELLKIKRSRVWIIAVILPLLAIITGSINMAGHSDQLTYGWVSLTSQVTLFYGLLFYPVGISLIASTVWRAEHQGGNWNLLFTSTRRPLSLFIEKILAIILPVTFMQIILVCGTIFSGIFFLHITEDFPLYFITIGFASIIAALPLIALQSLLSMLFRSFVAPIALCLLGCVIGIASITSEVLKPLSFVWPQGIVTRVINLGSSTFTGSGKATLDESLPLLFIAILLAAIFSRLSLTAMYRIKLK